MDLIFLNKQVNCKSKMIDHKLDLANEKNH